MAPHLISFLNWTQSTSNMLESHLGHSEAFPPMIPLDMQSQE